MLKAHPSIRKTNSIHKIKSINALASLPEMNNVITGSQCTNISLNHHKPNACTIEIPSHSFIIYRIFININVYITLIILYSYTSSIGLVNLVIYSPARKSYFLIKMFYLYYSFSIPNIFNCDKLEFLFKMNWNCNIYLI